MQEQDHIFTNNFIFRGQFQKRQGLCLNPQCPNVVRNCISVHNISQNYEVECNHRECRGWILSSTNLKNDYKQNQNQGESIQIFDFLKNPIASIKSLNKYSEINWEDNLKKYFLTVQQELKKKLTTVYQSTCLKIGSFLLKNQQIAKKINMLGQVNQSKNWSLKHEHIYRQIIEELKNIQKTGLLKVINNEALKVQINSILVDIGRLQWSFWVTEQQIDRQNRKNIKNNDQLDQLRITSSTQQINKNLQKIHSALKLKPFAFQQKGNQIYIQCGKCNLQFTSQGKNKQIKRSECLDRLLNHLCSTHSQQILQKLIVKNNNASFQISYQQFLRQACSHNYKTFVVIDRQNISKTDGSVIISEGVYNLEVVSKGHQNLAMGKYVVAQSNGKDAADILIIIILNQLVRISPSSRKILLTKDHFGKTLQQIFEEGGTKILLSTRSNSQMLNQINNQSQCIIID